MPTTTPQMSWSQIIISFSRVRLCLAVTLSALTGYIMFTGYFTVEMIYLCLGVLLLGCGCSALNQIQEAKTDGMMTRTKNRPIPTGQLTLPMAWFLATMMILCGLYFLACLSHHVNLILLLSAFTLVWYNVIYTYMKKWSAYAVFPGAALGVIPPLMGWLAAGGVWYDKTIVLLSIYFFVWQIPHFWMLLVMHGNDYENAGLKTMTSIFNKTQFNRLTFVWLMASALIGFLMALFQGMHYCWTIGILLSSIWLVYTSAKFFLANAPEPLLKKAFLRTVIYNMLIMLFITLNALI
jgi:protoheme IX farnesyltransferase